MLIMVIIPATRVRHMKTDHELLVTLAHIMFSRPAKAIVKPCHQKVK